MIRAFRSWGARPPKTEERTSSGWSRERLLQIADQLERLVPEINVEIYSIRKSEIVRALKQLARRLA